MLDPIKKTIQVPCAQQLAFEVFLHEMDTWWPLDKFSHSAMRGAPAKAIRVDPREGGAITEVGHDDLEVRWGTVRSYDPYAGFSMDFHVPHPKMPVDGFTLVQVTFTPLEDGGTRVDLTQSNWDFLGELADSVRGGYQKGWDMIFGQAYRARCAGS